MIVVFLEKRFTGLWGLIAILKEAEYASLILFQLINESPLTFSKKSQVRWWLPIFLRLITGLFQMKRVVITSLKHGCQLNIKSYYFLFRSIPYPVTSTLKARVLKYNQWVALAAWQGTTLHLGALATKQTVGSLFKTIEGEAILDSENLSNAKSKM